MTEPYLSILNKEKSNHALGVIYLDLFEAFLRKKGHKFNPIEIAAEPGNDLKRINNFFVARRNDFKARKQKEYILSLRGRYDVILGNTFAYEFTDGDLKRVKELINELKDHLTNSERFTPDHKQRLLRRLEKLQGELKKKMPDVDGFWGLMGEAGVAMEMHGKDAASIVEHAKEIMKIVWRTQTIKVQLESGIKMNFLKDWGE